MCGISFHFSPLSCLPCALVLHYSFPFHLSLRHSLKMTFKISSIRIAGDPRRASPWHNRHTHLLHRRHMVCSGGRRGDGENSWRRYEPWCGHLWSQIWWCSFVQQLHSPWKVSMDAWYIDFVPINIPAYNNDFCLFTCIYPLSTAFLTTFLLFFHHQPSKSFRSRSLGPRFPLPAARQTRWIVGN